ncbi:hypothetical protein MD484_g1636, partial [Candolleomyces efflorescens]
MDQARDKFMGPEEEITEDSVHFERLDPKPNPVKKGTRCWTLGYSLEPNTNIEAPCANGKANGEAKEYHDITQALIMASTTVAMEDMEHAPEGIKEVLKSEFHRHGMAPLGCSHNWAYHAVQCNLAFAGKPIGDQMGRFGGGHRDGNDCPGHFSTIVMCCKLPPNYHPPRLFFVGLGVYADLDDYDGLTFQGAYDHEGTPPYPIDGTEPSSTAYRLGLIHYTPKRVATADTRLRIGALPTTQAFLAPEMRSSKYDKEIVKILQQDSFANFIRDGVFLMEEDGFVPYVGRVAYLVVRYLLLQAHPRFEFEIDPDTLARAITYVTKDGSRDHIAPWTVAPPVQDHGPSRQRQEERDESERNFKEHVFKHGSMIPYYFMHSEWIKDELERRYGRVIRVDRRCEAHVGARINPVATASRDTRTPPVINMKDVAAEPEDDVMEAVQRYVTGKRKRVDGDEEDTDSDDVVQALQRGVPERRGLLRDMHGPDEDVVDASSRVGGQNRQKTKKSLTRSDDGFKLLQVLTVDNLEDEILELRMELLAEEDHNEGDEVEDVSFLKDSIDTASDAVDLGGIGERAVRGIASIMANAMSLSKCTMLEAHRIREHRKTLIKAHAGLRSWIEGPVAKEARKVADRKRAGGGRRSWVGDVTDAVIDMLLSKKLRRSFKASDFGLAWECEDVDVQNFHTGSWMIRGEKATVEAAVAMTVQVVEGWVGADRYCEKKQAWFASTVEEVMGEEALSLNITWKLYNNLKASHIIQGDRGYRNPTKEDVLPFRAALEAHSVLNPDHREGILFGIYKQLYNRELSPSEVLKILPSVSTHWEALQDMIQDASLYDEERKPRNPTAYFKKLQSNPHAYHPLRERAPDRKRWRQELLEGDGPIDEEIIFSLLGWRAFPQVYSWHPDDSVLHSSPSDFIRAYEENMKSKPSDTIVKAVNRFWKMLEERRWSSFAETYPTFEDCYQHFKPTGALENRIFPKLSKTNAFDVVCDLAYARVCQPPTTMDVARHIVQMNSGAMTGLKALGLVDNKRMDVESKRVQVHHALLDLGELLKDIPYYAAYDQDEDHDRIAGPDEVDAVGVEYLLRVFAHSLKSLT